MRTTRWKSITAATLFTLVLATGAFGATFEGTTDGIFQNATGPSTMVTSGEGTSLFTWGTAAFGTPPSSLEFTGTAFATEADTLFSFGTLDYFNGAVTSGTGADTVDLYVTATLTSPTGTSENFTFPFQLINTLNTSDPNESADYVNFVAVANPASFSYNGVDYTLQFLGFGNIVGEGFSEVNQFHVLESDSASADLIGQFTARENVAPVPEPGTMLLLGSGLLGLAGYGRKRTKK